jgi:hypothetical protein
MDGPVHSAMMPFHSMYSRPRWRQRHKIDRKEMFDELILGPAPLTTTARVMLVIWCLILAPWVPVFSIMGAGMAFEGGDTPGAYLFVLAAWTYPVLVCVAWLFRRRKPVLVWLPVVGLLLMLADSAFP